MEIFRGMMTNPSDKTSDLPFEVNNFGYYKSINQKISTLRQNGRSDYQLIYIDKGCCTIKISGEKTRLSDGNIILFPPFVRQEYTFSEGSNYYWIHFSGTDVENILNRLNLKDIIYQTKNFFEFKEIFNKMIMDNAVNDLATAQILAAHVISLLCMSSRKIYTKQNPIHKVIEKMQTDFSNRLKNDDYAKICGLSQYHFIRKFKNETGVTPLQYKNKIIISRAIELLETTNLNISEIAHMLGFEDSLYFSRVFKKETGVSPKKYNNTK